jgi:hypothetical protein
MLKKITPLLVLALLSLQLVSTAQPALQWAKSIGGDENEQGTKLTHDALGNTYLTGYFSDTTDFDPGNGVYNLVSVYGDDFFIQKLDADGNLVWAKGIGSVGGDRGLGIELDSQGNVFVTGLYRNQADFNPDVNAVYNMSPVGVQDGFILKLDNDGNFMWAKTFGGTQVDGCWGMDIDASDNVVVCGFFSSATDFDPSPTSTFILSPSGYTDIFVCKLTNAGNFIRACKMGGANYDNAFGMTIDNSDNIITIGRFAGSCDFNPGANTYARTSAGGEDVFISKLDSACNFLWAATIGSTGDDYATDVTTDSLNNVYTTGYFVNTADFDPTLGGGNIHNITSAGAKDAFISKLDSNGLFVWAKTFGSTTDDGAMGIFVKPSGKILCTGYFTGTVDFDPGNNVFNLTSSASSVDAFVMNLNTAGDLSYAFNFGDLGSDIGYDLLENSSGEVICTGSYSLTPDFDPDVFSYPMTSAGLNDMYVCKYNSSVMVGIDNPETIGVSIYPNPFSSQTIIAFEQEQTNIAVIITDVTGRELKTIRFTGKQLVLEREAMSAGIYYLHIAGKNNTLLTKKVLLQ